MEDYILAVLKSKDKYGTSTITIDELEYDEAKCRIIEHLEFIFKSRTRADLTFEAKDRSVSITRSLERVNHAEARDGIIEFLKYVYQVESSIDEFDSPISSSTPYTDSSWVGQYNLDDLTQMEKVFILLKHNHEKGWVKSQNLKEEYEIMYGERIKLSSLSTYLARLYEKGSLERKGSRAQRVYRMSGPAVKASP